MSKGKKPKNNVVDSGKWDEGLIKEPLQDDLWQSFVIFVAPGNPSSESTVQCLASTVETGVRRKFFIIEKQAMLHSAREDASSSTGGGGGKKSKQGTAPTNKSLHPEVCEHVLSALNSGDEVPQSLVARMLKYKILKLRTKYLAAREAQLKEADEAAKRAKGVSAKGKGGGDRGSKKGKDTPGGKGDVGEEFPMPQKGPTTMKKRGEEDLESKYIDDEPQPGPNAYILLQGFHEAELFTHLATLGISANALFKIINSTNQTEPNVPDDDDEKKTDLMKQEAILLQFWYDIGSIVSTSGTGSMLKDMAQLEFTVDILLPELDSEESKEIGLTLFNELATRTYSVLESWKQYRHYIDYIDMQDIPLGVTTLPIESADDVFVTSEITLAPFCTQEKKPTVDMRYYNELLETVPEESITPSIILSCMLEQVELSFSGNLPLPLEDSIHNDVQNHINDILSCLPQDPNTEKKVVKSSPEPLQVIHWQDQTKLSTFTVPDQSCLSSAQELTKHHSLLSLSLTFPNLTPSLSSACQTELHALKQFTLNVPVLHIDSIFNSLLTILSMEYIPPPSTSDQPLSNLTINPCNLLFDYPLDFPLEHTQSTSTAIIPIADEAVGPPSSTPLALNLPTPILKLSNYSVLEPLSKEVILQVIQNLRSTHPYIQLYYHQFANSLIVSMYSGYTDTTGTVGEYTWQRHIHSKIGFNNYLKFVAEWVGSTVDAAVEEDEERREAIEVECKDLLEAKMGALKEKQETEKQEAGSKASSATGGKKSHLASAKKTPSGKGSKLATPTVSTENLESDLPHFTERKLYTGYDVGDKVLLSNGRLATTFTSDGAKIVSERINFVNGPVSQSVSLIHNGIHLSAVSMLNTDEKLLPPVATQMPNEETSDDSQQKEFSDIPNPIPQPPEPVLCRMFEANLKNNVNLSFSHFGPQGNGQLPIEPKSEEELAKLEQNRPDSSKESRPPSQDKKLSKKQQEEQQRILEQQQALEAKFVMEKQEVLKKISHEKKKIVCRNMYQQLSLTTTQGLHVTSSTMVLDNTINSVIITQNYLTSSESLSNELTRCYLPDGTVIKEMKNGNICILCSDGKVYETVTASMKPHYETLLDEKKREDEGLGKNVSTTKVSFNEMNQEMSATKPGSSSPRDHLWTVTYPDGAKHLFQYKSEVPNTLDESVAEETNETMEAKWQVQTVVALDAIHTYTATDPQSKEVLLTRGDKVMIVNRPDGSQVVEHADGTRITSSSTNIILEHPLFSRAIYSTSTSHCILEFSSGLALKCSPLGQYVITNEEYELSIAGTGEVKYSFNKSSDYTIYLNSNTTILKATDSLATSYAVNTMGEIQVTNKPSHVTTPLDFHPHFFIIQQDGSGHEIHHKDRVDTLIKQAKQSPQSFVIAGKLPQYSQCDTTTIISPCTDGNMIMPYKEANIIPKSLQGGRSSTTKIVINGERKKFGVGVGKALDIGGYCAPEPPKVFTQPKNLKYCHFINMESEDLSLRESFMSCLSDYIKWKEENKKIGKELLPQESEEDTQQSAKLLECAQHFKGCPSSQELLKFYENAWKVAHCPPLSSPPCKKSKLVQTIKDLKEEIKDTEDTKETIRNGVFPSYFKSYEGVQFLHSISPDMDALEENLASTRPKRKSLVSFDLGTINVSYSDNKVTHSNQSTPTTFLAHEEDSPSGSEPGTALPSTNSLSKLRPSNPTPIQAYGDRSPTSLRPMNPTPHQAIGGTISDQSVLLNDQMSTDNIPSAPCPPITSSLIYQVSGELRKSPVQLPCSISGTRPGEEPNVKFSSIEEPVRRKVHTSSTANRGVIRGFVVTPNELDFGILKEGCTYSVHCDIKNVGIDTCRFKIKAPPPSTGIKVLYTPGYVVAGMSRQFDVEIFALAVGSTSKEEMGTVYHELEITTETSVFHLPIRACVYPSDLFVKQYSDALAGTTPNVRLVSDRPLSRDDLHRPRHNMNVHINSY